MSDVAPEAAIAAPVPADVGKGNEDVAGESDKGRGHRPKLYRFIHNRIEQLA